MKIEVLPAEFQEKYAKDLKAWAKDFLSGSDISPQAVLTVHFVSRETIRHLNKMYREVDTVTDVLSFPIWEKPGAMPERGVNLGDIFICLREIEQNARTERISSLQELKRMYLHSLEHLIGKHH